MVSYTDSDGQVITQLAVVGNNNVLLINHRALGISELATPAGNALGWLRDGILEKMGRK